MIQEFIDLWFKNKDSLQNIINKTRLEDIDYSFLVKSVVEYIINSNEDEYNQLNIDALTVIDDGDYQGTQLFILPKDTYQPDPEDYYFTNNYYGSCSGCDTLEAIRGYEDGLPNGEQVKELMMLCLHLVERFKPLIPNNKESDVL